MYDSDATVLLNVYIHLVFVGEGYLALVPSCLPHLRQLCLVGCNNVRDKYLEELVAAVPELEVIGRRGEIVRNKHLETDKCCTSDADDIIRQWAPSRSFRRQL